MPHSLEKLPYEILSYVVDNISLDDVKNLARISKQFQFLERQENICRKLLQEKLPHCHKIRKLCKPHATCGGFAAESRRITKRHDAINTASPYSVAVLGVCDHYLYSQGVLCYVVDASLRIIDLHNSHGHETVVDIHRLLREILPDPEEPISGKFRILYYNEKIISCLYKLAASDSVGRLIVFDLRGQILINEALEETEKIFVRHNSKSLYYGTFTGDIDDQNKSWVIRGFQLQNRKWCDQQIHLPELIGSDIGVTVCFEIIGDHFYAVSNQTTSEVEEVDWTSFYHCARFPVGPICKEQVEKTPEDKSMWRRQHREGPLDDRWGNLSLHLDEVSGEVNIIEIRKELTSGASTSKRTCYTTKVPFQEAGSDNYTPSSAPSESSLSIITQSSQSDNGESMVGPSNSSIEASASAAISLRAGTQVEKLAWVAVTKDQLALTLTASDNPHWCEPQRRDPEKMHTSVDGSFVLSQTPIRYYNASARCFVDLVNDLSVDQPDQQRLRVRISSQRPEPRKEDPMTSITRSGEDDNDKAGAVTFWPPDADTDGTSVQDLEDWYSLLNPLNHQGKVVGTVDSHSMLYVTSGKEHGQPKAIVFINWDPAICLPGLKRWGHPASASCSYHTRSEKWVHTAAARAATEQGSNIPDSVQSKAKGKEKEIYSDCKVSQARVADTSLSIQDYEDECSNGASWIRTEKAMYRSINRGFDFGWCGCLKRQQ